MVTLLAILYKLIYFVVAITLLVLIHEGGHFLVAKAVGMKVNEFAIGMGPKLWSRQKGETLYSLRAIPIGGFIKPEGEDEESAHPRAFGNKPLWARAAVVAAGPIFNFVFAFLIVISLVTFAGVPVITVGALMSDMPAAQAGLQLGDKIIKVNGKETFIFEELIDLVNKAGGQSVKFTISRNNQVSDIVIPTKYSEQSGRFITGFQPQAGFTVLNTNIGQNFKNSFIYSQSLTKQVGYGLKRLFTGKMTVNEMAGPVRIYDITGEVAKLGIPSFIHFVALLSLSLGLFNLFPIPALDGGRLLFMGIEGLRGKAVDQKKEAAAHLVGFALLIGLMLFVTFNDIKLLLGM